MIDYQTADRIKQTANIVEVISDFVTLRKAGANYKCLCPFHSEKTPSFMVSPAKGIFKCFSCGVGGDAVRFLMLHEQMSYPEALRWLAKKYHIEIHEKEMTEEDREAHNLRESLFIVNQWAAQYYQDNLYNTREGQAIGMAYFRKRGFRDDIIKKFQLGYALEKTDATAQEAVAKGYKEDYLVKTGLCYRLDNGRLRDKFHGRVIFPVHSLNGKIVAFGGRVLNTDNKNLAKYLNSPESEIYLKRNELYGIYLAKKAIQKNDRCFLVEGYTDVISMHQSGIENVVASSGTSLTYEQIRLVKRFTNNLTVLYDGDMAGIKASLRGINMLLEEGMNIKVLLLPDNDDPDSFARKHNAEEYVAYIDSHQEDFIRFKLKILMQDCENDPSKKAGVVNNIIESISVIPDAVLRALYTKECSGLLEMNEQVLIQQVQRQRRIHFEEKHKQEELQRQREEMRQAETLDPEHTASIQNRPEDWITPKPKPRTVETTVKHSLRYDKEFQIIKLLMSYGERPMGDQGVNVIQYIASEMDADSIHFEYEPFEQIMNESKAHMNDQDFVPSQYFIHHTDGTIADIAVTTLSRKYQLSKDVEKSTAGIRQTEDVEYLVPLALIDLKLAIVRTAIKNSLQKMQSAGNELSEQDRIKEMEKYQSLKEIEKQLVKMMSPES
jgi:DNA primase